MGSSHSYLSDPATFAAPLDAKEWREYDYVVIGAGT